MAAFTNGLSISLSRGPFQNNGASPWYAEVGLGTPEQTLKFSFDTGSNFIWVTSSLCSETGCTHYGNERFQYENSTSFQWINQTPQEEGFGPWGSMIVETGNDIFTLQPATNEPKQAISSDIFLAKSYSGSEFAELNWDGGIGLPSTLDQTAALNSNAPIMSYRGMTPRAASQQPDFDFIGSLVDQQVINSNAPYVTFQSDYTNNEGLTEFGRLNPDYQDSKEYLFFPWEAYAIPSVSYIWSTPLTSLSIGDFTVVDAAINDSAPAPYSFVLDTGASQFKGDTDVVAKMLKYVAASNKGDLVIKAGQTDNGEEGTLVVPSTIYEVYIEEGEDQGEVIPQFGELAGLYSLILAGSVLLDHLYVVYEYSITGTDDDIQTTPVGMWVFNKPDGPKVITTTQSANARIFQPS